jgi:hypothetical protein
MWVSTSWRKSSYSDQGGSDCVEVAFAEREAAVRDSKNSAGPVLVLPTGTWLRFVGDIAGPDRASS